MRSAWPLAVLLLGACQGDPCDHVRDLTATSMGLELAESEHEGWGIEACFQCHATSSIHQRSCVASGEVDAVLINDLIDPTNTASCVDCHGTNGLPDPREEAP